MKSRNQVIDEVKLWTKWWVTERRKKLENQLTDTMAVNPFVLPFFFDYHGIDDFEQLADLILSAHLLIGHNTGFGKLIDEKILPNVFGTAKLSAEFRKKHPEFMDACFNEVDHVVHRPDGKKELLSLKAGKWTIQLTMAMQLNSAFNEIATTYPHVFDTIVVGVIYGKGDDLTDKYEILRGINRGKNHRVIDLRHCVFVHSGREFWSWLNEGAQDTQEWVLEGIIQGVDASGIKNTSKQLIQAFRNNFVNAYEKNVRDDAGNLDWFKLLKMVNG